MSSKSVAGVSESGGRSVVIFAPQALAPADPVWHVNGLCTCSGMHTPCSKRRLALFGMHHFCSFSLFAPVFEVVQSSPQSSVDEQCAAGAEPDRQRPSRAGPIERVEFVTGADIQRAWQGST